MSKFEGDRFIPLRPLNSSRLLLKNSNKSLFHQVLEEVLLGGEEEEGGWWEEGGRWDEGGRREGGGRRGWWEEGVGGRRRDEGWVEEDEGGRREGILKFSKRKKVVGLTIKEVYEKAEKISKTKKAKRYTF